MNQSIYMCAASLCCTLIICSIIRILVPSGSTHKIMSVVICVFTLCSLIAPVYELVKSIDISSLNHDIADDYSEKFALEYDNKVAELTAGYINEYVNSILESKNISQSRIETILSYDESRGIYIKELNIYLNGTVNFNEISDLIYSAVGVKPKISEL